MLLVGFDSKRISYLMHRVMCKDERNYFRILSQDFAVGSPLDLDQGSPNFSVRGPHCFTINVVEDHFDASFRMSGISNLVLIIKYLQNI